MSVQPANYLEAKIKTASPAQLQLMLVEGAIRFCSKAEEDLAKNNEAHANEAMVRAIEIVGEMLAGVRQGDSEINKKLTDLYQYLFYTLTSAYVNTDSTKLADVLRILEFERETWILACQRAVSDATPSGQSPGQPIVAPHIATPSPNEGFSLEA